MTKIRDYEVTDDDVRSLSLMGEIDLATAIVAIGLRAPQRGDTHLAARGRCADALNRRVKREARRNKP